jgi:hypothetical protein
MNYYQPTYTQVTQKALSNSLTEMFGPYQAALSHVMELEAISDGKYRDDVYIIGHLHADEDLKNAVKHANDILDLLNIENNYEFRANFEIIQKWFGNAVYTNKKEYVWIDMQWYLRQWHTVTLPKAKKTMGTIFSRDFHTGQSDSAGLSIMADDGKNIKALVNGGKMESRTKITVSEQQKFMRGMHGKLGDASTAEKYRQRIQNIRTRNRTVRTENVNDAAYEILGHARYVIFCGPTTINDKDFYQRIGVPELVDLLQLIAVMVRHDPKPVTVIEMDTRPFRYYYDTNPKHSHEVVAKAIANLCYTMNSQLEKL